MTGAPSSPRVLLVGPNPFETRASMWLFVECLAAGLPAHGCTPVVLRPRFPHLGRLGHKRATRVLLRLTLEAAQLRRAARTVDVIHVCDHASAFHLLGPGLPRRPRVVTCHDLFFVLRTVKQPDASHPLDRWWQRRILRGIAAADRIACISVETQDTLRELVPALAGHAARSFLLPNGLYQQFNPLQPAGVAAGLRDLDPRLAPGRYVLHVGGNFERKNRPGVAQAFAAFGPNRGLRLVFAGEAPDAPLRSLLAALRIDSLVTVVERPAATALGLLYQGAFALLFPSHNEGFGLPPLEAQTLGCPVVASDIGPHRSNLGDTALLAGSEDHAGLAAHLAALLDDHVRADLVARGFANAQRFTMATMIGRYAALHTALATAARA